MIPLRIKLLTPTAKYQNKQIEVDLLDLFCDGFQEEPESVCRCYSAGNRILSTLGLL
jgi:hypothetical protein